MSITSLSAPSSISTSMSLSAPSSISANISDSSVNISANLSDFFATRALFQQKETKEKKLTELRMLVVEKTSSLEERLGNIAIKSMQIIIGDNQRRMEGYHKKISLLGEGIFYQDELCEAMLKTMESSTITDKAKEAIRAHFKKLKQDGAFCHGAAPSSHFTIPEDLTSPTGKAILRYLLKDSTTLPSDGLATILQPKNRVFLACGEACQVSYMKALQEVFGPDKFNYLFGWNSPTPFFVGAGPNSTDHPMYLLTTDRCLSAEEPLKQGEWVFFQGAVINGVHVYGVKHINGADGSWNTVCLNPKKGEETYLGLGLNVKGETHANIEKTLLNLYNKPSTGSMGFTEKAAARQASLAPKAIKAAATFKDHTMTINGFRQNNGGKIAIIRSFDLERIQALLDATPAEGRVLLQAWKEEFSTHEFSQA